MPKLTNSEFIERARTCHGDRYDYSQVVYQNYLTKVVVLCPEHGPFTTTPANHLHDKGCPACGILKRAKSKTKTSEWFVQEAIRKHGERYDYSKSVYTGKIHELTIICPVHGEFSQKAGVHLRGHGCPKCGLVTISEKKRSTLAEFLAHARAVHGDKYDYSCVDYQGSSKRVTIICPEHGPFEQLAADHTYNGSGCPACVGLEHYGAEEFIRRSREMHGDNYDYANVKYVNARTKVEIICPKHGAFMQPPHHHMKGVGCPGCKADKISESMRMTQDEFVERALAVHGGKYDYSQTVYEFGRKKIIIICPEHGPFSIEARLHTDQGTGCPDCAESGFRVRKPALLYYLRVTDNNGNRLYKIGITNRTVEDRFSLADLSRIVPIRIWEYAEGQDALDRETEILRAHKHLAYRGKPVLVTGNSELFISDVLALDLVP